MTIGFSPFLTAEADESLGFRSQSSGACGSTAHDPLSARLELIRRRVLTGYYSSPTIATELARRLLENEHLIDDR